jgi:predicted nucleic acid-binding protein
VILVDSSVWLDYFAGKAGAVPFLRAIGDTGNLVVPTVCIYEVYKWMSKERGKRDALKAVASMRQGVVADLDAGRALDAASLSREHGLPMADAIIYATARAYRAEVVTKDAHFKGLPGVRFIAA